MTQTWLLSTIAMFFFNNYPPIDLMPLSNKMTTTPEKTCKWQYVPSNVHDSVRHYPDSSSFEIFAFKKSIVL